MTEANAQPITQQFSVEIVSADEHGVETKITPALASAVTSWEREFPEDKDTIEEVNDFMLSSVRDLEEEDEDDSEDEGDDDSTDEDDADEEVLVEEPSDSSLNLEVLVNRQVLADIKALQEMDADERLYVRIIYGEGALVRQFTISPDVGVLLSSGAQPEVSDTPLSITVIADIFDSETLF